VTAAVIFIGTPHRGSSVDAWANIITNLAQSVLHSSNTHVIEALSRGSEVPERPQDSFSGLLQGILVYTLLEGLPRAGGTKVGLCLVSASLPKFGTWCLMTSFAARR
jgi:hypothetical protein